MDVGPPELLIILVIALVLFGGAKLPQLAKGLGGAKREYERGLRGDTDPEPEATTVVVEAPAVAAEAAVVDTTGTVAAVEPDATVTTTTTTVEHTTDA
ncbi:twin-arginine translocase TatA/TatE family subunit [Aquihabitans sp. G128]|uniref:twin-arginine translocase TatA/TatE family subunit n=1 Tax=Aquihabitans sp. G128 TaxID=2849779 RepID=UPI001C2398DD|nr:twin-arginine translocase TatA/TatE family subunit [Aquihabitans sp. G128]QXC62619.1 twin-arginine translocase TatA/TatE family subunit [Aquihabitans sp. G128]